MYNVQKYNCLMTYKLFYGNLIFGNNVYHLIKFKIRITYITLIYWIPTK